MSKKNQTTKGKEKQVPERELLYDKYYLIDEKKCLYGELNGDGIYYRIKGGRLSSGRMPDQQMITLHGLVLQ